MRPIVALALVALFVAAAAQPVPWTSCGTSKDLAKIVNATITPFPPGSYPPNTALFGLG